MAVANIKAKPLRDKICLANSLQFDLWKEKDLPRLSSKYPKFKYLRLVDTGTDKNYVWYSIR